MLKNQHKKFRIPKNTSYLNCAVMSPFLKKVESIGHKAVSQKCLPFQITVNDFFEKTEKVKELFSKLVSITNSENVAIIPSVSYGIATVANNIVLEKDDEILIVAEQFPSNVYSWQRVAEKYQAKIKIISPDKNKKNRGENWNQKILQEINVKTKVVAMPHVHWSDGTLFDLKSIRKKTKKVNALLIIDGTQSVGALPFSVKKIKPDALICASYKWLLGPYSLGLAYYSDELCKGIPIEENWINRKNSEDFSGLVNYEDEYQPKAGRFNVGEMSNFILTPMLIKSLEQLIEWQPKNIQKYCKKITKKAIKSLEELGCFIENKNFRSAHLFGIYIPNSIDLEKLKNNFLEQKIHVSFRGDAIRVSSHLYNSKKDFKKMVDCFNNAIKK